MEGKKIKKTLHRKSNLIIFLLKPLKERRFFQLLFAGSSYVKDILLSRFHSRDVLIERSQFTLRLGAVSIQVSNTLSTNESREITPQEKKFNYKESSSIPLKS